VGGPGGRYGERRCYWFVGGGPNTATAWRGGAEDERSQPRQAVGFNSSSSCTAAWAALEREDVVFFDRAARAVLTERCPGRRSRGQEVGARWLHWVREDDREISPLAAETIAIPRGRRASLADPRIVPLQLFIYHVAVHRGVNPIYACRRPRVRALVGSLALVS